MVIHKHSIRVIPYATRNLFRLEPGEKNYIGSLFSFILSKYLINDILDQSNKFIEDLVWEFINPKLSKNNEKIT